MCIYQVLCDSIFAVSIINQESSIKKRIEMKKVILTLALVFTALSAVANPASVVAPLLLLVLNLKFFH